MTTPQETTLWRGRPSQWTNFGTYLLCLILAAADVAAYVLTGQHQPLIFTGLALPLVLWLVVYAKTRSHTYELTTQRLRESRGMLSRQTSELELYRVRDYTVVEPLMLRLVGCGTLILQTADRSTPEVVIRAVHRVNEVKELIRTHTEQMRQSRGVRDFEINPQ